ncbi:MAG: hypothetical protein P4L64_09130 [Caulobacteraceae bacterium]|nr:hypothetical protein [Caulobacteraceae bacterium]
MRITDETLMAYVAGELDAADRVAVERAARTDAALARRIQAQRRLRQEKPVPLVSKTAADALKALPSEQPAVASSPREPATVVDLAEIRSKRTKATAGPRNQRPWVAWILALACVILAVGVGLRLAAPRPGPAAPLLGGPGGPLAAEGPLAVALDQQLGAAAVADSGLVRMGISFRNNEDVDCRTFRVLRADGFAGLACREGRGWKVRVAVATSSVAGASSAPSLDPPPLILAAVSGMIAGAPFDARQEAEARAHGWKP